MFNYILQIVPNSSNYDTNPGNVHKGYKIYKKCSITFFKLYQIHQIMILILEMYIKDSKCSITIFKLYQIQQIMILIPEMYKKNTKLIGNVQLHFSNWGMFK